MPQIWGLAERHSKSAILSTCITLKKKIFIKLKENVAKEPRQAKIMEKMENQGLKF